MKENDGEVCIGPNPLGDSNPLESPNLPELGISGRAESKSEGAAISRGEEAERLVLAGFRFAPARIGETHGVTGWNDLATDDPAAIWGWLKAGSQLVMVAKRAKGGALDFDDLGACIAMGFDPKWIEGCYRVATPSGDGHAHAYLPWHPEFAALPERAKIDIRSPEGKLIAEWKIHNSTVAAPWSFRAMGENGKAEGYYVPETQSILPCPSPKALVTWALAHAEAAKPAFSGPPQAIEFHPQFDMDAFLESEGCSEKRRGMVRSALHVEVEECPHCGEPARHSTLEAAVTKFIFGGNSYGFICHKCGVNSREAHESTMAEADPSYEPWGDFIYKDDDHEALLQTGEAVGLKPKMIGNPEEGEQAGGIAHAVPMSEAGEMEVEGYGAIPCTDLANCRRFARLWGHDIAFVEESALWYVWNGKIWAEDRSQSRMLRRAKETVKAIFAEAMDCGDGEEAKRLMEWCRTSASRPRLEAMIALARSEGPDGAILKSVNDFDQDAYLLNCRNGIVDLRDGTLLPHDRKALMMKICRARYDPEAQCPAWLKFLDRVQRGDGEMIGFLQRLAGYCLWGTSEEQAVHFLYGSGRNGKGVFLLTLLRIMGSYAVTVPFATFLEGARHNASGPNEAVAGMAGKRLVVAQESNPTGRFNESLLKTLTGGDRQKASFKYQHEFEFDPLFTLILAANHKPRVIDQSDAIKSRIKLIPFTVSIPEEERDLKLIEKLWAERDGILAWMVRGAAEWARSGLGYPAAVKEASKEYFADQDVVGQWLAECAEEGPYEAPAGIAYGSFKAFAEDNNFYCIDNREFKSQLEQRGFRHRKGMAGRLWRGFRVTRMGGGQEPEPSPEGGI